MSDFLQFGEISTLHNLRTRETKDLVAELKIASKIRPTALCLPSLYSDLFSPAMDNILAVLSTVEYLSQIIIALDRADQKKFEEAKKRVAHLPQDVSIVWVDGARIQKMFRIAQQEGLETGHAGKGRAVWIAIGYAIASGKCKELVLHDCDILTYTPEFLARLCYPVMNSHLGFSYVKGYYARVSEKLNGRVMRLFVVPLLNAMIKILGHHPLLEYLRSFRYPLAGEFGMSVELAKNLRIPNDWGIEVSVLAEVYRSTTARQVCQVELCDKYDHKHQNLDSRSTEEGLMKMAIDIATAIFRNLAIEGVVLPESFFATLRTTYLRQAQNAVNVYQNVAELNGLEFYRHDENLNVDAFSIAIRHAAEMYLRDPLQSPVISNWNRVDAAMPGYYEMLLEAVAEDNK